jgi:serine/threonine protein kinase
MPLEIGVNGRPSRRFSDDAVVILGRDRRCDVHLDDRDVSSRHALLVCEQGDWCVYDLKSRKGVELNGQAVRRGRLNGSGELKIGPFAIALRPVSDECVTDRLDATPADHVEDLSPSFRLGELIHRGRSGDFYRGAWTSKRDRPIVVKFIAPRLASDEAAMYKFCRGVTAAGAIRHPHILRLYRAGKSGQSWYLIMEWMAQGSLRDRIRRDAPKPLPPVFVRRVGVEICRALEAIGERGLVHRKITPASVLFDQNGSAKLGDFVLAREEMQDAKYVLTMPGESVGEIQYMAPEQAAGRSDVDARADVYGLGAVLYEALAARPPRAGQELVLSLQGRPSRLRPLREVNPAVSVELEQTIQRALAVAPEDRFPSASHFRKALEASPI